MPNVICYERTKAGDNNGTRRPWRINTWSRARSHQATSTKLLWRAQVTSTTLVFWSTSTPLTTSTTLTTPADFYFYYSGHPRLQPHVCRTPLASPAARCAERTVTCCTFTLLESEYLCESDRAGAERDSLKDDVDASTRRRRDTRKGDGLASRMRRGSLA